MAIDCWLFVIFPLLLQLLLLLAPDVMEGVSGPGLSLNGLAPLWFCATAAETAEAFVNDLALFTVDGEVVCR